MGFVDAVKSFYKRYVDFSGRSSRSEYWWVQLFYILTIIILTLPLIIAMASSPNGKLSDSNMFWIFPVVVFILAGIIPMIALTVRRFHDQDKSGWFFLLNFIPSVGGIIVLVFMCLKGTAGPNRFGHDPLGTAGNTFD